MFLLFNFIAQAANHLYSYCIAVIVIAIVGLTFTIVELIKANDRLF